MERSMHELGGMGWTGDGLDTYMQVRCMCSCLGAREKESPSHMHFGHCWTLFGVWCSVALFGSVVPEGRRSCAVVSADRGPEGRGRGVPQGYRTSCFRTEVEHVEVARKFTKSLVLRFQTRTILLTGTASKLRVNKPIMYLRSCHGPHATT